MISIKKIIRKTDAHTQCCFDWLPYLRKNQDKIVASQHLDEYKKKYPEMYAIDVKNISAYEHGVYAKYSITSEEKIKVEITIYSGRLSPKPEYLFTLIFDTEDLLPPIAEKFFKILAIDLAETEIDKEDEDARKKRIKQKMLEMFGGD